MVSCYLYASIGKFFELGLKNVRISLQQRGSTPSGCVPRDDQPAEPGIGNSETTSSEWEKWKSDLAFCQSQGTSASLCADLGSLRCKYKNESEAAVDEAFTSMKQGG